MTPTKLLPALETTCAEISRLSTQLDSPRLEKLAPLIEYIVKRRQEGLPVALNFICTHNSRRSHLGQLWAAVAAHRFGVQPVSTYSGGTEATAFNPRAVAAIERAGFQVTQTQGDNPRYTVTFSEAAPAQICFSKKFDDETSPTEGFAAVMTCNDADQNCPVIVGATRLSLPYVDPKEADDTPQERSRYDERSQQIGSEMFYVFSEVARRLQG